MSNAPGPSASPAPSTLTGREKPQQFLHRLPNGLTLVAERIPAVRSAAMTFLVPAGAASDPLDAAGAATVLSDWILRGAGDREAQEEAGGETRRAGQSHGQHVRMPARP